HCATREPSASSSTEGKSAQLAKRPSPAATACAVDQPSPSRTASWSLLLLGSLCSNQVSPILPPRTKRLPSALPGGDGQAISRGRSATSSGAEPHPCVESTTEPSTVARTPHPIHRIAIAARPSLPRRAGGG